MINGKWQVEGQYVQNSDEVEIGIMNPKSQKYQTSLETEFFTNEFKLFEKGCFGGTPEWEAKGDTICFPVKIPVKNLDVDYGGHFYVQIGDLFLKNKYEMILQIKMPYKNKFIGFDKQNRK